ncbi:MAG TPA: YggS family pyridoxal phosphate-dependent enzyme [Niabella sp.]|jgi:pyridoxal phosphate enzyme (YggS family)|nr:YggS family pyridoxal phosphate-dependent enzyme [Chitinophagaceae bacterium]HRO84654.1 YggS family pyridoxal phosphate-dependent enzyme [Niabella sp.]
MSVNQINYKNILSELQTTNTTLVAVSKTKPAQEIRELYDIGQRDFGENYVQELTEKAEMLPKDIRWHFIGHLQRNKVKYIASFVHLIHGVDSEKLLNEINKEGRKNNKVINCLLQIHIAQEETKFGFDRQEVTDLMDKIKSGKLVFEHVKICGLMGMASFTEDMQKVKAEFEMLQSLFKEVKQSFPEMDTLSMGMSGDYNIAVASGSTMVRIGSLLFGARV